MRDSYVIVYNKGSKEKSQYVEEVMWSENGTLAQTVRSVVDATIYDTWDEAWNVIVELREANIKNGFTPGSMFPLSVNKKDIFLAKLKGQR